MKYILILFVLFSITCTKVEKQVEFIYLYCLKESEIFNKDKIWERLDILQVEMIENSDKPNNYFLLCKEKSEKLLHRSDSISSFDLDKAIYLAKRAITIYPLQNYYIRLAELAKKKANYSIVTNCYRLIIKQEISLWTEKYSDNLTYEYYKYGLLSNSLYDELDYLLYKDSTGILEKFLKDDDILKDEKTSKNVKNLISLKQIESDTVKCFEGLLTFIKDSSQNIQTNQTSICKFSYDRDYDEGPNYDLNYIGLYQKFFANKKTDFNKKYCEYNFSNKLKINDSVIAITYKVDTSTTACPSSFRHIFHYLATFTKTGKLIQYQNIGYQDGTKLATYSLDKSSIEIMYYTRNWRNPYKNDDFDNLILNTTVEKSKKLKINSNGTIEEIIDEI